MKYNPNEYDNDEPLNDENDENTQSTSSSTTTEPVKMKRVIQEPTRHELEIINNLTWKLQIVLTKCDLVERSMLARRIEKIRSEIVQHFPYLGRTGSTFLPVMMVSGLNGNGVLELQKELAALVPSKYDKNKSPSSESPKVSIEKQSPENLVNNVVNAFSRIAVVRNPSTMNSSNKESSSTQSKPSNPKKLKSADQQTKQIKETKESKETKKSPQEKENSKQQQEKQQQKQEKTQEVDKNKQQKQQDKNKKSTSNKKE